MHEAAQLQDDLRRAGIEPCAWVINQGISVRRKRPTPHCDSGPQNGRYISKVTQKTLGTLAIIPWMGGELSGPAEPESASFLRQQLLNKSNIEMETTTKPKVLILCTGNSCRSHMAEGILRNAAGDLLDVYSAGSKPAGYVHPKAIQVLKEIGIDISHHSSKHMDDFLDRKVTTVITVCGNADQVCPMFPGQVNRYHWGFDDPAHAQGTEEEVLETFRRVRDQIKLVFEAYAAGYREASARA